MRARATKKRREEGERGAGTVCIVVRDEDDSSSSGVSITCPLVLVRKFRDGRSRLGPFPLRPVPAWARSRLARLCSYGSFQMDVPACLYMRLCVCVCVCACVLCACALCMRACACTPAATRRRKLARRHGRFSQRPRRIAGYHASSRTRAPLSPTRPARYCSTPPCGQSVFGAESRRSTRHGACHTGRSHSCSRRGSAPVAARRRTLSPPEPPAPHIR